MTVTGTYRLQLHEGFGFADAQAQLPYLASLGVSHLYLSPVLQAVPGSMHGYDVLDHTRVSQDLGGEEGLRALAAAAREHDLGLVVDVVPNHMALVAPESANAPLWAVLREGRDAPTAHWFDIDWKSGGGRLGLPGPRQQLAETLEAGDLVLDELDGQPVIRYFEHVFPVALGTEGDDVAEVAGPPALPAGQLARHRHDAQLPALLRGRQLIAVRVELPDVFEATHRVLLGAQPRRRHRRLPDRPPGRAGRPRGLPRPAARGHPARHAGSGSRRSSRAPSGCPPPGPATARPATTRMQRDPGRAGRPRRRPRPSTGLGARPAASRRGAVGRRVQAPGRRPVARPGGRAADPPRPARPCPSRTLSGCARRIVELLVAGEVYRAYLHPDERLSPLARKRIEDAFVGAVAARPDLEPERRCCLMHLAQRRGRRPGGRRTSRSGSSRPAGR